MSKYAFTYYFRDSDEVPEYAELATRYMYVSGIVSGKPQKRFEPNATATRAEAATMLRAFSERSYKQEESELLKKYGLKAVPSVYFNLMPTPDNPNAIPDDQLESILGRNIGNFSITVENINNTDNELPDITINSEIMCKSNCVTYEFTQKDKGDSNIYRIPKRQSDSLFEDPVTEYPHVENGEIIIAELTFTINGESETVIYYIETQIVY